LHHCDTVPLGFKIDYWNPQEREATTRMDLTEKGA
jgi:hypothetical protein